MEWAIIAIALIVGYFYMKRRKDMANLVSVLPNGTEERAELTTNKADAGEHTLEIVINGVPHYAKLDTALSTHIVVEKNGVKYYVQKEINYVFEETKKGLDSRFTVPNNGTYWLVFPGFTISLGNAQKGETVTINGGKRLVVKVGNREIIKDLTIEIIAGVSYGANYGITLTNKEMQKTIYEVTKRIVFLRYPYKHVVEEDGEYDVYINNTKADIEHKLLLQKGDIITVFVNTYTAGENPEYPEGGFDAYIQKNNQARMFIGGGDDEFVREIDICLENTSK